MRSGAPRMYLRQNKSHMTTKEWRNDQCCNIHALKMDEISERSFLDDGQIMNFVQNAMMQNNIVCCTISLLWQYSIYMYIDMYELRNTSLKACQRRLEVLRFAKLVVRIRTWFYNKIETNIWNKQLGLSTTNVSTFS